MAVIFSLLDTPAFGGAEQYMAGQLNFLAQQGYDVVLATNNQHVAGEIAQRVALIPPATFTIINAPYLLDFIGNWKGFLKYFLSLPFTLLWLIWTLWQLKKEYGQVICLLAGFSDRLSFSPVIKLFGLPLIWIEFGPLEPVFRRNWGFPRLLYSWSKNFVNYFVTISESSRQSMIEIGKISPAQIKIIYPGVPDWSEQKLVQWRQEGKKKFAQLGLNEHPVITYLGRLAGENQVDLLLQAFAQAHTQIPNLKLLIIGDGPERERFEQLAQDFGIHPDVYFTGFVAEEEKSSLLAASSVFVYPRSWVLDGFGITTIEAMSLGIPVITPNIGPQREIIEDGISGIHFVPNNVDNLSQKMMEVVQNQKLQKKLSLGGKKRVGLFTDHLQHQKMLEVVQQLSTS